MARISACHVCCLRMLAAAKHRGSRYERMQGAHSNLGRIIGCTTIAAILKRHGIEPALERGRKRPGRNS